MMNLIQSYISEKLVYALGWTVLHSLWQAIVVALILGILMLGLQRHSARFRYRLANVGLLGVLSWSFYTFLEKYRSANAEVGSFIFEGNNPVEITTTQVAITNPFFSSFYQYFEQHLPLIVTLWLIGVGVFTIRVLGGLAYVRHLKYYRTSVLDPQWEEKLARLTQKLGLKRSIQLLESALVNTPMVIGWLKPVILLPIGAINHLRPEEVEAILAHELAHIYRNDYLLNILQSIVEVIFYFNPAVWWISANIRMERENCCDDIAVELCGNSITYAKALVSLQEMSLVSPAMAMTLARNKHQLLNRVKRILKQPQNKSNIMEKFTATCLLLLAVLVLSISANRPFTDEKTETEAVSGIDVQVQATLAKVIDENEVTTDNKVEEGAIDQDQVGITVVDSLPKSRGVKRIEMTRDGEQYDIKLENGEITFLEINGREIPPAEYKDYEAEVAQVLADIPPPPPVPPVPTAPTAPPAPPAPPAHGIAPPPPPAPPAPTWQQEKHLKGNVQEDGNVYIRIERKNGEKPTVFEFKSDEEPLIVTGDELLFDNMAFIVKEHPNLLRFSSEDGHKFEFDSLGGNFNFQFPEVKGSFPEETIIRLNGMLAKPESFSMHEAFDDVYWIELDDQGNSGKNSIMGQLKKEMIRDGLLEDADKLAIQLTDKFLKIKGEKVAPEVFKKYHELFEKLKKGQENRFFYRYREE